MNSHREPFIPLKSPRQIAKMRAAGQAVNEVHEVCREACRPGVTTEELDHLALETFTRRGAIGLFKGYPDYEPDRGYPANLCISINEEVVHGIPGPRVIKDGDIVSIDCGVRLDGWCGDAARTILVGNVSDQARAVVLATENILRMAIEMICPGRKWSMIASRMEEEADRQGYGVITEYVGHGIGRSMHEAPKVPNFVSPEMMNVDFTLRPGMVLAIEPMLALGTGKTRTLDDGWTVVTADGRIATHVEDTVVVTADGAEVLSGP